MLILLYREGLRNRLFEPGRNVEIASGGLVVSGLLVLSGNSRQDRLPCSKSLAGALFRIAVRVIVPGERLLLALDDTPTKRYGPLVQGAGIHHNPTPGPAEQKFLYGHVWVTLSWVVRHGFQLPPSFDGGQNGGHHLADVPKTEQRRGTRT